MILVLTSSLHLIRCHKQFAGHQQLVLFVLLLPFHFNFFLLVRPFLRFLLHVLVMLIEQEEFELLIQIVGELDARGEYVHLDLFVDFPGGFADDHEFVFEAALDHGPRMTTVETD